MKTKENMRKTKIFLATGLNFANAPAAMARRDMKLTPCILAFGLGQIKLRARW
ncbi:MAG TPA: hypothetical protein VG347_21745 [Verrucomicrobiae bacterium]|nr:hypothetical protein [Verrucomicrobiae bacterium]